MSPKVINCPHCGRVLPEEFWHEKREEDKIAVKCPRCSSTKNWKNANAIQRLESFSATIAETAGISFQGSKRKLRAHTRHK